MLCLVDYKGKKGACFKIWFAVLKLRAWQVKHVQYIQMVCYTAVRLASIAQWLKRYHKIRHYNVKASQSKTVTMTSNIHWRIITWGSLLYNHSLAHFENFMSHSYVHKVKQLEEQAPTLWYIDLTLLTLSVAQINFMIKTEKHLRISILLI